MRSTIFALLPLAGLTLAESDCPPKKTVTHTQYETVYETGTAVNVEAVSSTCSRKTVTATTHETVYVTATQGAVEDDTTTSEVIRSSAPASVYSSALYSNQSTSEIPYPTMSFEPTAQPVYSTLYSAVPLSEAPKPISEAEKSTAASAMPTAGYGAPAESAYSSAPALVAKKVNTAAAAGSKRGEATFYGGNLGGGKCSFTGYTIPSGIFGTALSDSNWAGASNCGACVQVTGPSGTQIKAMVVDECPGCGTNHLDLFENAFKKLADPSKGVINVSWDIVPCGITSPIVLKNKEGTSKYWFSMQVMNSNEVVSKLEVSTDGGKTWKGTERKEYNFFENPSGFGTDSVDVKVTSASGKTIVVKSVSIAEKTTKTGGSNFA